MHNNASETIFLNTQISLLHLCHVERAASLTVHCCWTPRHHHHRVEVLLPTVPPPAWSTYDVTVRAARNLACTEPYMHPTCTAIRHSNVRRTLSSYAHVVRSILRNQLFTHDLNHGHHVYHDNLIIHKDCALLDVVHHQEAHAGCQYDLGLFRVQGYVAHLPPVLHLDLHHHTVSARRAMIRCGHVRAAAADARPTDLAAWAVLLLEFLARVHTPTVHHALIQWQQLDRLHEVCKVGLPRPHYECTMCHRCILEPPQILVLRPIKVTLLVMIVAHIRRVPREPMTTTSPHPRSDNMPCSIRGLMCTHIGGYTCT